METIISLVVLVAIYSVVFVIRTLSSKTADVKGSPVTGEVFPTIEVFNGDVYSGNDGAAKENVPHLAPSSRDTVKPKITSAKKEKTGMAKASVVTSAKEVAVQEKEHKGVSLKSKSEARRAFIHAEIFNKKY